MRHGQTLFNKLHKIQGASDSPLTAKGIRQAEIAGDHNVFHGRVVVPHVVNIEVDVIHAKII